MTNEILIICITVFFARILDVSIGTIRTIFVIDGKKYLAAAFGFLEVFIWFMVVREALTVGDSNIFVAIFYAAGFASGTIIGSYISNRLVIDKFAIYIVTSERNDQVVHTIRDNGFAVTKIECTGREDSKRYFLYVEIRSNRLNQLKKLVKQLDPNAFLTVNKSKIAYNGFFR